MAIKIFLPKLGESIEQASISHWCKKVGDFIERGEVIAELESSKATMDIESPISGFLLKIYIEEDVSINAGTLIAVVGADKEEDIEESSVEKNFEAEDKNEFIPVKKDIQPTEKPRKNNKDIIGISPNARRMANNLGIDLNDLLEAFPDKRITSEDIQNFIKSNKLSSS